MNLSSWELVSLLIVLFGATWSVIGYGFRMVRNDIHDKSSSMRRDVDGLRVEIDRLDGRLNSWVASGRWRIEPPEAEGKKPYDLES
jgi:hypothetical protein